MLLYRCRYYMYKLVVDFVRVLGSDMFVEGGLNTNYTILSNLFGSLNINLRTN